MTAPISEMIKMAERHRDQDMLMAGGYWDHKQGKGCSVGCFNKELGYGPSDYAALAKHFGIPKWAIRLQDEIFEGLPASEGHDWHVDACRAYASVDDWQRAMHRVYIVILRVVLPYAGSSAEAVERVIALHERAASGEAVGAAAWSAARSAADAVRSAADAAWSAADAAERAAERAAAGASWNAAGAAWNAASAESAERALWSAASASWSAARSAASSMASAARKARDTAYSEMAKGIIAALRNEEVAA